MLRALHPWSYDPPERVSDLIYNVERRWNRELMQEHMLLIDAHVIFNIPWSLVNTKDCWAWHYKSNGHFIVRSVYRLLIETKHWIEDWMESRATAFDTVGFKKK